MRPEPTLRCHQCGRVAPKEIADLMTRRVIVEGHPGHVVEARGWALRLGGGDFGATVVSCSEHQTASES